MNKMNQLDLCEEKIFINLEDDLQFLIKNDLIISVTDENNNIWTYEKKIGEGTYGNLFSYKSNNLNYTDIIIKIFKDPEEMEFETNIVKIFNLARCKNYLRSGVKIIDNKFKKIVIMEKIDGDLLDINKLIKIKKPKFIFGELIKFFSTCFKMCLCKRILF